MKNLLIIFLSFIAMEAIGQDEWEVSVTNAGSIDGRVENFLDVVQVSVFNPGAAVEVNYLLTITRAEVGLDISNTSFYQDYTFMANPSPPSNTYSFRQLTNRFDGIDIEDYDFGSTPPGYEEYIREQRRFPPGNYITCLSVYDEMSGMELASSCLNFTVSPRNPPMIQNPPDIPNGSWMPGGEDVFFTVGWIHPEIFNEEYTLEIKRFADHEAARVFDRSDHASFDALPLAIIPVEEIEGYVYNVNDDDVAELGGGDFIAIRVTADSDVNEYLNQGRSNIVIAAYGTSPTASCDHPNFLSEVVWPIPGDTLPFRNMHYVTRFEPLCDNLLNFEASFTTSDGTGSVFRQTTVDNNWRAHGGPYNDLLHFANSHSEFSTDWVLPDSSYAQHLPLVHSSANSTVFNPVTPNENGYRLSGNMVYTYRDLANGTTQTQMQALTEFMGESYYVGMPRPHLISPANNDTLDLGDITFSFNTGSLPTEPLPPFQIMKIEGRNTVTNPYLNVQEKLVLQISTGESFSPEEIVYDGLRTIQASSGHPDITLDWETPSFASLPGDVPMQQTPDRLYQEDLFMDQVYKTGDMTFSFAEEDTVWWRVVWLQNPETYNTTSPKIAGETIAETDTYHKSQVRRLIIKEGGGTAPAPADDEEEEAEDCGAICDLEPITNTASLDGLAVGEKFDAGKFEVTVTNLTSSSGSFSGRGTLLIPFLNDLQLMVSFSGIGINTDRKMHRGTVTAIEDPSPFTIHTQAGSQLPYIDSTDVVEFNDWMNEAGRLYSFIAGDPIGLPVGIDREIDGRQIIVAITKANFLPTTSNLNFVAGFEIPEIHTHVSLGVKDVCMHPGGFGADSVNMYLPYDMGFDFQGTAMQMKGGDLSTSADEICYGTFDCNGFKRAKVAVECKFPRSMLLPDASGVPSTDSTQRVKFLASARYDFEQGLMMRFTMDPFYAVGAENLRFNIHEAYLDLSSAINPPALTFPENYVHESMDSSRMGNSWEGFYMKRLTMDFPDDLIETPDAGVGVFDFIYDGKLSLKIGAYNIVDDGSIGDWKATLDTIQLVITQSEVDRFELNGKIEPPMAADGEHLNYRAVFDFEASLDYYLQVDVEDSLNVPMVVAKMQFNGDSYVRVGRNDTRGAYIRANFSGRLTIDDAYVPEGMSSIPGMSMPYIGFEQLVMDSDTGVSCQHWDFAGLTGGGPTGGGSSGSNPPPGYGRGLAPPYWAVSGDSDQGFAAGFPLSIDSIGLGGGLENPKLHIKASLNFQQGENGISAGCALDFVGRFEDVGGSRKLRLDGVELRGIYVSAEFSAIKLEGSLEWEKTEVKEEIRGAIGVKIPTGIEINIAAIFGTYKSSESALFNTADNYNYWLVDGSVNLGENGVPICSGIAMFGIGGGVWHHMELDESGLKSSRETLSSPDATTRVSNTALQKYNENFNTLLGLRFNVVLGIQNSSSTVNLEVGVLAEFTTSHGLARLRIDGAVYVMQDIGTGQGAEDGGMLYGTASLEYTNNAVSGKTFTGEVDVWLNVGDFIKGAIDDNDKLADVNFYADAEEWYFHMGSYDTSTGTISPGAAIKLSVGDVDLVEASAYMMVGHRVPLDLPLPPENVRDLLGMNTQSSGDNEITSHDPSSPSTADYVTGVRNADGSFATGAGFAFGSCVSAELGIDAFIYFSLSLTVGFDVNLTKQEYSCLGYGTPGINGWYAQGQAYAAIEGELGLSFRFFGRRRIQLLYLGVGMMLEGKLVNPNYFKGTAGVRFSVLGGAFEGRKTLSVEFGEQCQPIITDPLANIQFIEKIEPNQSMGDVSVFSVPSTFFNFGMDRDMLLPRAISPDTGLPTAFYRFRPFVSKFEVTQEGGTRNVAGRDTYTPDRKVLQRIPENGFAGNSRYNIECDVKVRDYTPDAPHALYRDSLGKVWVENKTEFFTTGDYPDVIPESNVEYTYPLQKQRFFLQDETNKKGTVCFGIGMGSSIGSDEGLFYREKDDQRYNYVLRLTKAGDFETKTDIPLTYTSGKYIELLLPPLENEEIYLAQIVRVPEVAAETTSSGLGGLTINANSSQLETGGTQLLSTVIKTRLTQSVLGYSDLVVRRLTPDMLISEKENKLFEWYFRTSKYNTLSSKLSGVDLESRTPSVSNVSRSYNVADVEVEVEEGFDYFDLHGLYRGGNRVLRPLVSFVDPMTSDYWTKHGPSSTFYYLRQLNSLNTVAVKYYVEGYPMPVVTNFRIYGWWPNGANTIPYVADNGRRRSFYKRAEYNATYPPLNRYNVENAIEENYEEDVPAGGGPLANTSIGSSSLGLGLGGFGGITPSVPITPSEQFFNASYRKLLLNYDLSKQAFIKVNETKAKINSFYYLQYNVQIDGQTQRVNLPKMVGQFVRDNPSPQAAALSSVQSIRLSSLNYVTTPYVKYTEFGNQNVSNRYHVRFRYFSPRIASGLVPSPTINKSYLMTSDPSRIPSGTGPH